MSPVSMNGTIGIYPNPTEGTMTIANIPATAFVTISDALGREQNIIAQSTATDRQLDLSKLPSGVCLVRLEAGGVRTMHQVVRE